MASPRKPRDFKAEYERRVAKAIAAGKTRQAGRGHQDEARRREAGRIAREAVKREQPLRKSSKPPASGRTTVKRQPATKQDLRAYRDYIRQQAYRSQVDPVELVKNWLPYFIDQGRARFEQWREARRHLRGVWDKSGRVNSSQYTLDGLEAFARQMDGHDWMLFYH